MSVPRRRIVRSSPVPALNVPRQQQAQRLHSRLDTVRSNLARWMGRLRRAFHAVEKLQTQVTRLERQLTKLEDP